MNDDVDRGAVADDESTSFGSLKAEPPHQSQDESLWSRYRGRFRTLIGEVARFGVVGLMAFAIDVGLFNVLLYASASPITDKPLTAKAISVIVATLFAYTGNRLWTFKERGSLTPGKGYLLFFALNAIAMLIAMTCLAISHYLLGFTGPLADNISANGFGLVLGTAFRFWSYRKFVFPVVEDRDEQKSIMGTVEI